MKYWYVSVLAALAPGSPALAQSELLHLSPTTGWVVDYDEDQCEIRRAFEHEDNTITLQIMQQAPGAYFRLSLESPSLKIRKSTAKVAFLPDPNVQEPAYLNAGSVKKVASLNYTDSVQENVPGYTQPYIQWTDAQRDAREASVTGLLVRDGFASNVLLMTGEMHAPMAAMRTCMSDLYGGWGVDVAAQATLTRQLSSKNSVAIYRRILKLLPAKLLQNPPLLSPIFRVMVGADGKPTRCRGHFLDRHPSTAEKVCAVIMAEAEYIPALDAAGKPIASYDTMEISLWSH